LGNDYGRSRADYEAEVKDGGAEGVAVADAEIEVGAETKDCLEKVASATI